MIRQMFTQFIVVIICKLKTVITGWGQEQTTVIGKHVKVTSSSIWEIRKKGFCSYRKEYTRWKKSKVGSELKGWPRMLFSGSSLSLGCVPAQGWRRTRVQEPRERRENWAKFGCMQFIVIDLWVQAIQLIIWVKEREFTRSLPGFVTENWGVLFRRFYLR